MAGCSLCSTRPQYSLKKSTAIPLQQQMEEAVDYIRSNYDDCMLNVNMLADRLNISASYFGKLFREFTGCSALEYTAKTPYGKGTRSPSDRAG